MESMLTILSWYQILDGDVDVKNGNVAITGATQDSTGNVNNVDGINTMRVKQCVLDVIFLNNYCILIKLINFFFIK